MKTIASIAYFAIFCVSTIAHAANPDQKANNWHQWRGPLASGVAPNGNPPTEWSPTKNVKWKVAIPGRGSASPIVWGDRIYILTAVKTDRTAAPPKEAAASDTTPAKPSAFEDADSDRTAATFALAQNDPPPAEKDRPERRGPGFGRRGPGGRGFGGPGGRGGGRFGIEAPTNFYQFNVMCIDRNTGKTIWEKTASEVVPHEGHHQTGSFASASPITDGKLLYASFGSRGIYCYDLDGNAKWNKDLGDFKIRFSFGEGSSPALYGDRLVQTCDQEAGSFIVALDAKTGDEIWRKPREESSTWATPLVVEAAGRTQVVTSGRTRIRSYDLANGDLIWECGGLGSNPIACPVVVGNLAIAMTGHEDPAGIAVPLDSKGDITDTDKIAWRIENTPYVPSPLVYGDTIYFTKSRNGILSSVAAKTGEFIISQQRLPDMNAVYASPVAAGGRIYLSSREGTTVVVKHDTKLDVLATNHLDEPIDASPAIVGKDLIIRTEGNLYCISE
jgi:outer membrane protein assembly factor BamB